MTGYLSVIVAGIMSLQNPVQAPAGALTMDEAVQIAERNAFAVKLQKSAVEKSRQQFELSKAQLGPTAAATGVYTKNGTETTVALGAGQPPIIVSPLDSKVVSLNVSFPIDISGNLHRLIDAARAGYHAQQQTLQASLNDARLNARTAYLAVLRAQASVGVSNEALRNANAQLDQGRKLFAGQQIARVDVIRYESQVAQANSDLLNAQNTLQTSKYALNDALARPIETPVTLVDIQNLPTLPSNTTALVNNGETNRPEVKAYRNQIQSLVYTRRADMASLQPTLGLGVGYQRVIDPAGFTAVDATTTGTATLNVPIFDSGATKAKVKAAEQDIVQAQINLQQAQLGISQEVRNAVTNLASAKARLENADQQVALSREVYRLANIRQQAGEGTYVDVIDAENTLTQSLNTQVGARYDFLLAYSQLQRAIGSDNVAEANAASTPSQGGSK